ncbi:MAG TPA: hypothetical protein VGO14_09135 [Solirubrobacteraceae bacterium]|nr:hypothetical protein [Solirubrobacteraceae bacterium]
MVTGEAAGLDSLALDELDALEDSVAAADDPLEPSELDFGALAVEAAGVLVVVVVVAFVVRAGSCPEASWT